MRYFQELYCPKILSGNLLALATNTPLDCDEDKDEIPQLDGQLTSPPPSMPLALSSDPSPPHQHSAAQHSAPVPKGDRHHAPAPYAGPRD